MNVRSSVMCVAVAGVGVLVDEEAAALVGLA